MYNHFILSNGVVIRLSEDKKNPCWKDSSAIMAVMYNHGFAKVVEGQIGNNSKDIGEKFDYPEFIQIPEWSGEFIDGDEELKSCPKLCCICKEKGGFEFRMRSIYMPKEFGYNEVCAMLNYVRLADFCKEEDGKKTYYRTGSILNSCIRTEWNLVSWNVITDNKIDA